MLLILAEARQAAISSETYEVYSSHLAGYPTEDIQAAVSKLALTRREAGETAFPDLATLVDAVTTIRATRLKAEREQRDQREREAEERHRREHPEEYVSIHGIFQDMLRKKGIEAARPAPKKQVPVVCEHCRGVDLTAMSAADLRALADVVEKREAMGQRSVA